MTEVKSTGEAIRIVRTALYDLARQRGARPNGASKSEVISYCTQRKLPALVADDFERAIRSLREAKAVSLYTPLPWQGNSADTWYRLTTAGDEAEEQDRRSWVSRAIDDLRKPTTVIAFILGILTGALGLVLGEWIKRLLFGN